MLFYVGLNSMKKNLILIFFVFGILMSGCQTIQKKTQEATRLENEKLSKLLNQPVSELKIVMGEPDKIILDDKGSKFLVYLSTKYKITCERRFESNQHDMIIGFSSKNCW